MYNHVYNSDNNFHKITGEMLYHNETGTKFLNEINKKKHVKESAKTMMASLMMELNMKQAASAAGGGNKIEAA